MQINETINTRETGEKYILITFYHHRAEIYRAEIPFKYERCSALRSAKARENIINEFLNSFNGKKYTKKEVLKAYSKINEYFKSVYKSLYPQGGYRNGGRKKGQSIDPAKKSPRTESFGIRITKEEKAFLINALERFRQQKLYIEKMPEKAKNINPALLPYAAEYALLTGQLDTKTISQIPEQDKI